MKTCLLLPLAFLTACQSFGPQRLEDVPLPAPLFSDVRLAELEGLRPSLPRPFRLGVAPPLRQVRHLGSGHGSFYGFESWRPEERALIEGWGRELQAAGHIHELEFLPPVLVDPATVEGESLLLGIREAAARRQVDAVLLVHSMADLGFYQNFLVVFDLTLIGAAFVPGHTVESRVMTDALLVDTRSEYLYLTAAGSSRDERDCAVIHLPRAGQRLLEKVELGALKQVGDELERRAEALAAERASGEQGT